MADEKTQEEYPEVGASLCRALGLDPESVVRLIIDVEAACPPFLYVERIGDRLPKSQVEETVKALEEHRDKFVTRPLEDFSAEPHDLGGEG